MVETYTEKKTHGCGNGEKREEHTLHVCGSLLHSSDRAPIVKNLRRSSFAEEFLDDPLLCKYTTFSYGFFLQYFHNDRNVIISVPLIRYPRSSVFGINIFFTPID
jgi:hypothetical protein